MNEASSLRATYFHSTQAWSFYAVAIDSLAYEVNIWTFCGETATRLLHCSWTSTLRS